ncbi:MAG: DNA adenine methylase, partial [Candidatus Woesearchaeota archaeon]
MNILKWAGGKSRIAPKIEKLTAGAFYSRVVEPFCGSCALTFYIRPKCALLCDINPALINCFEQIQKSYDKTLKYIKRL